MAAAATLADRAGPPPDVALVLGSGFAALADALDDAIEIPYGEIPGFPGTTVEGHRGAFRVGMLAGCRAAILAGRFHLYEGHDADTVALPARAAIRWGARTLIVTNAAGGINRTFRPGDLMLIDDHINLMWGNPLIGRVLEGENRFPDMSAPYDPELLALAESVALAERIRLMRGTYCALLGPSYETPAEVRMLAAIGADAVGMSTVPETLVARAAGVPVLGLSLITNMATGVTGEPLSHDDVMAVGEAAAAASARLLRTVVARLPAAGPRN
ncbi:MAG: purine-nucleoside phosphorylase [Gemmatimonadota bacterium]